MSFASFLGKRQSPTKEREKKKSQITFSVSEKTASFSVTEVTRATENNLEKRE